MNYKNNFYYYPDKSGLEIIESLNIYDDYGFDMFIIWKNKDNNLYYAQDTGCSCPTPFEEFNSIEELSPITHNSFHQFKTDFKSYSSKSRESSSYIPIKITKEQEIIQKIKDLLNK
jgi:hypothetical protein